MKDYEKMAREIVDDKKFYDSLICTAYFDQEPGEESRNKAIARLATLLRERDANTPAPSCDSPKPTLVEAVEALLATRSCDRLTVLQVDTLRAAVAAQKAKDEAVGEIISVLTDDDLLSAAFRSGSQQAGGDFILFNRDECARILAALDKIHAATA